MKIKYKPWAKVLMYLVEAIVIILSVFPILWVIMSSFKTNGEILSSPLALPAHFSLDTFIDIFQKYSFPTYFFNSLLAAGVSTLVSLLFYAMGAYVIAKFEFPGRKLLFALFTITLLVPSHSKTQPIFSLITKLNLYDSIWGVTLVYLSAGMAMSIFVLKAGFIKNVIGPDEYKDHVDNNAFTNYLTVFAMEQAERCIKDMPTRWPDAYAKLRDSYDLNALAAELQDKKAKVYLPQPNADGIVPQNAQYLGLDAIDLSKYKNQQGVSSIYEDYSPAQMNQLMVSKQADLVMLMRIMPDLFDAETRRKNFMFYESRTLHDSSLSHGQHCVLAAWEGLDDMALDMYRHAIAIDLGPNMKSSDLGIHSASMGNVWQCVVCGFAGLEWHEGGLSLRSHLPASWQRAAFNIVWRGAKLHVEVTHAGITVTHRGGSAVEITVDGHPVKLAAE